jgi:hypothetical protein
MDIIAVSEAAPTVQSSSSIKDIEKVEEKTLKIAGKSVGAK